MNGVCQRVASCLGRGALVALAGVAALIAPGPSASGSPAEASGAVATIGVAEPLGMTDVVDVSKTGRYVLGMVDGRYVVRDVDKGRTVRKLPSTANYAYYGLSDSGRYVVYVRTKPGSPTSCYTPWVRDRITNRARNAATTAKGKPLAAGWVPTATACGNRYTPDSEEPSWRTQITYSVPTLSGNGRYVAFCVNLTVPDRLDLYVKDMRKNKVRMWAGACSEVTDPIVEGRYSGHSAPRPQAPQISETGRVVLLPGSLATGAGFDFEAWRPASILVNRSAIVGNVGGDRPVLAEDGSAVYSVGPTECARRGTPGEALCPWAPFRYDVAMGTASALPAGDPGPFPMSRRGRYVLSVGAGAGGPVLQVLDRATGVSADLTSSFLAAGVSIPVWSPWISGKQEILISEDGKVIFVSPSGWSVLGIADNDAWFRVKWM